MAITIGTIEFLTSRGWPRAAGEGVEQLPMRPGDDAARVRKTGLRAGDSVIETTELVEADANPGPEARYLKLVGTYVTIVDGFGKSHSNCMILEVQTRLAIVHIANVQKLMATAAWIVHKAHVAPVV